MKFGECRAAYLLDSRTTASPLPKDIIVAAPLSIKISAVQPRLHSIIALHPFKFFHVDHVRAAEVALFNRFKLQVRANTVRQAAIRHRVESWQQPEKRLRFRRPLCQRIRKIAPHRVLLKESGRTSARTVRRVTLSQSTSEVSIISCGVAWQEG